MNGIHAIVGCMCVSLLVTAISAQQNRRRDRGESFYRCSNSNTTGPGNVWVSFSGVGHVWDDSPISTDTVSVEGSTRKWVSNIRAFPELSVHAGILEFLSVRFSSRPLSYGFRPEWFGGGFKLTWPNNQDLRLHGFGCSVDYRYQLRESAPSLGGYLGFMPEGFVVKGHTLETVFIYELDFLPRMSLLPIRLIANAGMRFPLSGRPDMRQTLGTVSAVYSSFGFDFFVQYCIQSFHNLIAPLTVDQGDGKRFLVWFSENPAHIILGGNVRYDNGLTLSLAVPLLVSVNQGSRMRSEDITELYRNENPGLFSYEKKRDIHDPFDPWYVKWKIVASLTFPLRFRMTGAEMMRNYLMLKNRKQEIKIDIDRRIGSPEELPVDSEKEKDDAARRLERIRERRKRATP